jgi:hypothetical protein
VNEQLLPLGSPDWLRSAFLRTIGPAALHKGMTKIGVKDLLLLHTTRAIGLVDDMLEATENAGQTENGVYARVPDRDVKAWIDDVGPWSRYWLHDLIRIKRKDLAMQFVYVARHPKFGARIPSHPWPRDERDRRLYLGDINGDVREFELTDAPDAYDRLGVVPGTPRSPPSSPEL